MPPLTADESSSLNAMLVTNAAIPDKIAHITDIEA